MASAAEMRGLLGIVRRSQFVMALGIVPAIIALIVTRDPTWAAIAIVASQFSGLLALCIGLGNHVALSRFSLLRALLTQALWAAPVGLTSFASSRLAVEMFDVMAPLWRAIVAVAVGSVVGVLVWVITLRWNGIGVVLAQRGVRVPQFMRS
jgi:hypothetical protein